MRNLAAVEKQTTELVESPQNKGFETKINLLGKMVFDIANTNLLPSHRELQQGIVDESEGQSIVEKFLIHICPVFEEEIIKKIGNLGRWRSTNLASIGHIANMKLLSALSQMHLAVHPRVMASVIDKGSLTENPILIEMWANYLVSACTFAQDDERYASYAHFLENISPGQATLFKWLAESTPDSSEDPSEAQCQKYMSFSLNELLELIDADLLSEINFDLMYLESLRLIDMQQASSAEQVLIRITPLGLVFYQNIKSEQTAG